MILSVVFLPRCGPQLSCTSPIINGAAEASGLVSTVQLVNQVEVSACGAMRDVHSLNSAGMIVPVRVIHPSRYPLLEEPKARDFNPAPAKLVASTTSNRMQPLLKRNPREVCL